MIGNAQFRRPVKLRVRRIVRDAVVRYLGVQIRIRSHDAKTRRNLADGLNLHAFADFFTGREGETRFVRVLHGDIFADDAKDRRCQQQIVAKEVAFETGLDLTSALCGQEIAIRLEGERVHKKGLRIARIEIGFKTNIERAPGAPRKRRILGIDLTVEQNAVLDERLRDICKLINPVITNA